jgi:hypothetical protein
MSIIDNPLKQAIRESTRPVQDEIIRLNNLMRQKDKEVAELKAKLEDCAGINDKFTAVTLLQRTKIADLKDKLAAAYRLIELDTKALNSDGADAVKKMLDEVEILHLVGDFNCIRVDDIKKYARQLKGEV